MNCAGSKQTAFILIVRLGGPKSAKGCPELGPQARPRAGTTGWPQNHQKPSKKYLSETFGDLSGPEGFGDSC